MELVKQNVMVMAAQTHAADTLAPTSDLHHSLYLLPHTCRSRQLLQDHQPAQTGQPLLASFQLDRQN